MRNHFAPTAALKLYHQSGVQVDLWKDEFADEIVARARDVRLAGRTVRMVDPYDLVAMKLRAGRLKDDYDIAEVAKSVPIDEGRLQSLVTSEQLRHFREIKSRS